MKHVETTRNEDFLFSAHYVIEMLWFVNKNNRNKLQGSFILLPFRELAFSGGDAAMIFRAKETTPGGTMGNE